MNRQDAKDAKEIESLEKVVIGASIGCELQETTGLAGARPKSRDTLMRRLQAKVADQSAHCRDRNRNRDRSLPCMAPGPLSTAQPTLPSLVSTVTAVPGFSCPNPITNPSILLRSCPTVTSPSPLGALGVLAVEFPCLHASRRRNRIQVDSQSGNGRPLKMNRQDAKDAKEIENLEKVLISASIGFGLHESHGLAGARKGALLQASPPGNGCRSVRSVRSVRSLSKSKSESGSRSVPALIGTWPSEHRSTRLLMPESHRASIHNAQVIYHRSVPSPLALLASWRLNSPAFTHPADGIESKWTVHTAMAGPIR